MYAWATDYLTNYPLACATSLIRIIAQSATHQQKCYLQCGMH